MAQPFETEIERIRGLYREMRFAEAQRKRLDLAAQAYIRTVCGFSTHDPKEIAAPRLTRAKMLIEAAADKYAIDELTLMVLKDDSRNPSRLARRADKLQAMKDAFDASGAANDPSFAVAYVAMKNSAEAAGLFIAMEERCERAMKEIVAGLPIWTDWAAAIVGLGEKSIGIIIGEAGDVGSYRSEAALWKRMGVAVLDGVAQGKLPKNAPAEQWIAHGYSRKRRSAMFTIGDSCIKCTTSPFRAIYLGRKEVEQIRAHEQGLTILPAAKITPKKKDTSISEGHIHRRAQRFMEKRILRRMYKAWKRTMTAVPLSQPVELAAAA